MPRGITGRDKYVLTKNELLMLQDRKFPGARVKNSNLIKFLENLNLNIEEVIILQVA